ncbi:hypothetical protein GN316_05080 [Xylophilus sp. Kf1]|nr:hypothetical protein [Xylophilus sp. Kf1]
MLFDAEPNVLEIEIGYVCSALLGLAAGGLLSLQFLPLEKTACITMVAVTMVAFALLARHYGDNFRIAFLKAIRWC